MHVAAGVVNILNWLVDDEYISLQMLQLAGDLLWTNDAKYWEMNM